MIVVSDTTPLISLLKINRLDLLKKMCGKSLSISVSDTAQGSSLLFRIDEM